MISRVLLRIYVLKSIDTRIVYITVLYRYIYTMADFMLPLYLV